MNDEIDSLVCSPVHTPEGHLTDAVAGSRVVHCDRCGREVWIAPSGQRMIDEKGLELVCIPCVVVAVKNDPDVKFGVHSESLVELRDHFLRGDLP